MNIITLNHGLTLIFVGLWLANIIQPPTITSIGVISLMYALSAIFAGTIKELTK